MCSKIFHDDVNERDLSYYLMLRETIHGLDNVIVTIIAQSFTIITGALGFSVLLYEKIDNKISATILALFLVLISVFITFNSKRRVKLYSDLLGQSVQTAQEIEEKIIKSVDDQITNRLQKNVKHAGMKGEKLYLRGINIFFIIEGILLIYLLFRTVIYLTFNGCTFQDLFL